MPKLQVSCRFAGTRGVGYPYSAATHTRQRALSTPPKVPLEVQMPLATTALLRGHVVEFWVKPVTAARVQSFPPFSTRVADISGVPTGKQAFLSGNVSVQNCPNHTKMACDLSFLCNVFGRKSAEAPWRYFIFRRACLGYCRTAVNFLIIPKLVLQH